MVIILFYLKSRCGFEKQTVIISLIGFQIELETLHSLTILSINSIIIMYKYRII